MGIKQIHHHLLSIALACIFLPALPVNAQTCDKECDAPTAWNRFQSIDIALDHAVPEKKAKWHSEFDFENNDLRIDMELYVDGKPLRGSVALVQGRTLLTQGFEKSKFDSEYLEVPFLYMRLAMAVLGRSTPDGPSAVRSVKKIELNRQPIGVRISTPGGISLNVTPQWAALGEVRRNQDDSFSFQIDFKGATQDMFGKKGADLDLRMSGKLTDLGRPVLLDAMSLEGWTTPNGEKSIAQVRAFVADEFSVGVLDASKNFAGLWKEKCTDTHGLHIAKIGSDGKYSISFCGPGGCFEPGTYRENSFISNDKSYRVVSESEIGVRGRGGEFSTYVRCTKDEKPPQSIAAPKK
jgi:hypothetical protein